MNFSNSTDKFLHINQFMLKKKKIQLGANWLVTDYNTDDYLH